MALKSQLIQLFSSNKPSVWTLRSEIDGEGGGMLDLPNIGSRVTGSPAVLIDCQPRVTQLHSTNATTSTIHDRVQTHRPTRSRPIWDPGRTGTEVGMKPSRDSTGVTSETEEERIQDTGSLLSLSLPHSLLFSELGPPPAPTALPPQRRAERGPRQEMA